LVWGEFCAVVRNLAPKEIWRHNVAGDLPGVGEDIDEEKLEELVEAAKGTRGFTYTHKFRGERSALVRRANERKGLVINLSVDGPHEVDAAVELGAGPVVTVLHSDARDRERTRAGRQIVVCPAQTKHVQCIDCGLCARPGRKVVIGFRAHGCAKGRVNTRVSQLRLFEREET
jgi:hypothetical protein